MASNAAAATADGTEAVTKFHDYLKKCTRVIALSGAGLSAASGLPTFRGAGGLWRSHNSVSLATPEAFESDPALVWRFYNCEDKVAYSIGMSNYFHGPSPHVLAVEAAHYALAELSRRMPGFVHLSQNVDGLSQRADHPRDQLKLLHGTLFEIKCEDPRCGFMEENFTDPVVPALAMPFDGKDPTSNEARKELDISDTQVQLPEIPRKDLPQCPKCHTNLLRPGVVWFGEQLPAKVLDDIDDYFGLGDVDLIIVIGTSAKVYPAAGNIFRARMTGAKVCVVNMDENDAPAGGWEPGDWFFKGDAAQIIPELLQPITGDLKLP